MLTAGGDQETIRVDPPQSLACMSGQDLPLMGPSAMRLIPQHRFEVAGRGRALQGCTQHVRVGGGTGHVENQIDQPVRNRLFDPQRHRHAGIPDKGDKRGHVLVDHTGEVYSLPRMLGAKSKDVRERLGDGSDLRTVADVRKVIADRMTPTIRRHIEKSKELFRLRSARLGAQKAEMTKRHRKERESLDENQKREWDKENLVRAKRLPKGLRGLWHRLTGEYGRMRKLNEAEARDTRLRHNRHRESLIEKQLDERSVLQTRFKELRGRQAEQLLKLRGDIGRYLRYGYGQEARRQERASSFGMALHR